MTLPLLSTKFNIPSVDIKHITRPRLIRVLDGGWEQRASLFLVCGPAGYGKTTAVSDWLRTSRKISTDQYTWLTLERGDDDLARFVTYLIAAVQHIRPGLGEGVLRMLHTHKPQPPSALATILINELSETSNQFLLILDDYHLLATQSIQSFTTFLVEHQPPQMSLALITRSDPLLPLARLRARRKLIELRQQDLCFRPVEVAEYFNRTVDLALSLDQVTSLAKQTEGWISGMQLAALSLRDVQDLPTFFNTFSGEHEFIADYLTDEVLSRLSEPVREFLLKTSILERMTASLCEAVTGQTKAQAVLEQLVDDSLFISPLDTHHHWFRYHTLFADLLRKRLHDQASEEIDELHRRACRWFLENNLIDLAIVHALSGKDYDQAASLIEQIAESYLMRGEATILLGWMEALSKETFLTRPYLASLKGFCLMLCGRSPQDILILLQGINVEERLDEFQGEVTTLQALMAILQGKSSAAIQLAELALIQLPAERTFFRSLAADSLGMAYTLAGDIDAATGAFQQVVDISTQSDNLMMTLMALTNLAGLRYVQGQLRLAITTCQQVVDLASQRIGRQTPIIGKTLLNLGEMVREQGNLDIAIKYLQEAAGLMEYFSEIGIPLANLGIARIYLNKKDWPAAQFYIDEARLQAQSTQSILMDDRIVDVVQARYWIARGELNLVEQWARQRGLLEKSPAELIAEAGRNALLNELFQAEYLTLIRLALAERKSAQALEMITLIGILIQEHGRNRRTIELLALKALSLHQMGDVENALQALGQALSIAEPEGYQRTFVDEGEPMARLLYLAATREISPAYSSRLLAVIADEIQPITPSAPFTASDLIEPLSDRELEVLGLIAEGLTNEEIAGRLYISLSTVKGHTTNIFGKLGVKNRTQAVARARSLGLLTSQ